MNSATSIRAGAARLPQFAPVSTEIRTAAPRPAAAPSRSAPAKSPWAFRGSPDSEIGRTVQGMVNRARQFDVKLGGDSVERMLTRGILANPKVTNEMLMQMSRVPLEKLADSPGDRAEVERRVPGSRQLPSHRFTAGMLSAITGIDPKALSEATPSLGLTGAPGTPLLFAPKRTGLQRSTALHDTTDYLRGAGIKGLNRAVWGVENRVLSALISLGGVPY